MAVAGKVWVIDMNIEIANRLVNLRKSNHLSQEALAEKLGISRQAVSKWERAEASPDTDNLIMLARLYHISLDELLRTDEEIILGETREEEQQGKAGIPYEREDSQEDGGNLFSTDSGSMDSQPGDEKAGNATYSQPGGGERENTAYSQPGNRETEDEHVDIGFGGVHVKDRDGSQVHIGWDGIHVEDAKKGDNVHVDRNGVYVNGEKKEVWQFFPMWNIPFTTLICIIYFAVGLIFNAWHPGWMLFLLIPIWYSFISAVKRRNANAFAYPVLVTLVYLCIGFCFGWWHPGWILYLTIPLYYSFFSRFIGGED